jgi:hypothetical protein
MTDYGIPLFANCSICHRGAEACAYCEDVDQEDWETICDCGLYDFGHHLFACEELKESKYVIRP